MTDHIIEVYDPKDPSSTEFFHMEWKDILDTNESISTVDSSISIVGTGKDPNLASMLSNSPTFSGTQTSQLVTGGIAGLTYRLKMTVTTDLGQVIPLAADIPVEYVNSSKC